MNRSVLFRLCLWGAFCLLCGCTGRNLDYAKPLAQFVEADVAAKGKEFLLKKITVKGTVTNVDVSDANSAKVFLQHGIQCNLGKLTRMAESCKIGETVYVDGLLKACEEGKVILDPAILRDPNAKFEPN
jgi:hypothetical protein